MIIFNSSKESTCLEDVPAERNFDVNPTKLAALDFMIGADDQCKLIYGPTAAFCTLSRYNAVKVSYCS